MPVNKDQKMTIVASDGTNIRVRLEVNPRASRLILRLDEKRREAVAVAPDKRMLKQAGQFAAQKADWIASRLGHLPDLIPFEDGAIIGLRGEPCRLSLEGRGRMAYLDMTSDPVTLHAPGLVDTFAPRVTRFMKKLAKEDIETAVYKHAETLGVTPRRIQVKDTRSRWGSCTHDARLSFSWRLICAPPVVLDYVAAHEVAHILEMNHSPRFWAQVSRCVPDWKRHRKWLHAHGQGLHAIGVAEAA